MKQTLVLTHPESRGVAHRAIDTAPEGYSLTLLPPCKSRDQEARYHALFGAAAKHCRHLQQTLDAECWKRLLVDQFRTDMLNDPQCSPVIRDDLLGAVRMMPSLDGRSIVAIGLQTRHFRKATAAALIDWLETYLARNAQEQTKVLAAAHSIAISGAQPRRHPALPPSPGEGVQCGDHICTLAPSPDKGGVSQGIRQACLPPDERSPDAAGDAACKAGGGVGACTGMVTA